jgi:hypothetical protein
VLAPAGNGGFVALACPPRGLLRAPAQRFEHAADMDGMVGDAKLQVNDHRNPAAGPDLPSEAIGFGIPIQEVGQTR